MPPKIRITVDGRLALTVEQLADRYRLTPKSISAIISREGVEAAAMLDGRKHLYLAATFDAVMKARPGKGRTRE